MISNEECIDTLNDVLRNKPYGSLYFYDYLTIIIDKFEEGTPEEEYRFYGHIDLLEKYAPRLFIRYSKHSELEATITKWVELYCDYLSAPAKQNFINLTQGKPKIRGYDSKSKNQKIKIFQSKIVDIFKLLNNNFATNEDTKDLEAILEKAYHNPHRYFNTKPHIEKNKDTIKEFLRNLNLENTSQEINNFLKDIK